MKKIIFLTICMMATVNAFAQGFDGVEYHDIKIEESKLYKRGNKYQKDFLLLLSLIHNVHPAYCSQFIPPVNLDSIQKADYKHIGYCKDKTQFGIAMQRILSQLHDGHTMTHLGLNSKGDKRYLLGLTHTSDGYLINRISKDYKDALGKIVRKINDVSIDDFIHELSLLSSADNDQAMIANVLTDQMISHIGEVNSTPFVRKDSVLQLTLDDSSQVSLKPENFDWNKMATLKCVTGPHAVNIRETTNDPFLYKIDTPHSIAYLQCNSFQDQWSMRTLARFQNVKLTDEQEKEVSSMPYFHTMLRNMFTEMHHEQIHTLVIDLRGNGGGNEILCNEILSWLYPLSLNGKMNPAFKRGDSELRISPFYRQIFGSTPAEDYFKENNNGEINEQLIYSYATGKPFDANNPVYDDESRDISEFDSLYNTSPDSIFQGKVIFIQDEETFSSSSSLILKAHDNNIGRVIGGPSIMNTSNYGSAVSWKLPNTEIEGQISFKLILRPDISRFQEKILEPSPLIIPSQRDILNNNDPCWEWILNHLGQAAVLKYKIAPFESLGTE